MGQRNRGRNPNEPYRKLSASDVLTIRTLLGRGFTQEQVVDHFASLGRDVSQPTISNVKTGRTHKSIR